MSKNEILLDDMTKIFYIHQLRYLNFRKKKLRYLNTIYSSILIQHFILFYRSFPILLQY
jgi:hypothetical protein